METQEDRHQQVAQSARQVARNTTILVVILVMFLALSVLGLAVAVIASHYGAPSYASVETCSPYAVMGTCN